MLYCINSILQCDCNVVNNNCQETTKLLFTFVPNKASGQLINISSHWLTILNLEFPFIKIWSNKNNKPLYIEDKVNANDY